MNSKALTTLVLRRTRPSAEDLKTVRIRIEPDRRYAAGVEVVRRGERGKKTETGGKS